VTLKSRGPHHRLPRRGCANAGSAAGMAPGGFNLRPPQLAGFVEFAEATFHAGATERSDRGTKQRCSARSCTDR
jgi:hypothetical protein